MNEEQNTTGERTETSVSSGNSNGMLIVGVVGAVLVLAGLYYYFVFDTVTGPNEQQQTTDTQQSALGTDYPEIVAVVNGEELSREALLSGLTQESQVAAQQGLDVTDATIQTQMVAGVMDRLINTALLLQAAKSSGASVSEGDITAEYARVAAQFPDTATFEAAVAEQGLTEAELREDMRDNLLLNAFIASDAFEQPTVSPEEIKAAYDEVAATQTDLPPLEEVATTIEAQLATQKQQAVISSFLESLRSEAEIEVRI